MGEKIIGCVALSAIWKEFAEICSLAVDENYKKKGIGKILVEKCIDKVKALKIPKVIALTYQDKFLKKWVSSLWIKINFQESSGANV